MTCTCCQGACCNGTSCTLTLPDDCVGFSLSFKGVGTTCSPNSCVGACCYGGTCLTQTQAQCGGTWKGAGTVCSPNPCINCNSSATQFPAFVYRTGGLPVPGNCNPVQVGTLSGSGDSVVVSGGYSATYSSVEAQVKDACGRCVFSGNASVSGGGTATLYISGGATYPGHPFVNTPPWCNNNMCNPLP
jgi:hypothetical protein